MRKLFVFLSAAILSFSSCTEKIAPAEQTPGKLTLTARIEGTKVDYTETQTGLKSSWALGDKLIGWWQNGSSNGTCTLEVKSIDADGTASLELANGCTELTKGSKLYLAYAPAYNQEDFTSDHCLSLSFNNQKSGLDGRKDFSYLLACTTVGSEGADLFFTQQTSLVKLASSEMHFPAEAAPVVSYTVSGDGICGSASFEMIGGEWTSRAIDYGTINVTAESGDFYVNIPCTDGPASISISAKTSDGKYYKADLPGSRKLEKGKCYVAHNLEFSAYTPAKKSISILAIGNSFSVDALEYLHPMLKQAGYSEVIIGNLYIGGCTLQTHASNLENDSAAYTYYKNTAGTWSSTSSRKASSALTERNWDYVSLQQASGWSGVPSSYSPYLASVIAKVHEFCPSAKLLWHMTWAYAQSSSHSDFSKYDKDQMNMYESIVSTVKSEILTKDDFCMVIPCGTAVQNLRTSLYGDNITRDGYHMSYNVGRFVTALTWLKKLTDCDLASITYKPNYSYTSKQLSAIKEAATQACYKPYEVSQSHFTDAVQPTSNPNLELRAVLENKGYDLSKYMEADLEMTKYAFYYSVQTFDLKSRDGGATDSNIDQFCATRKFSKAQLPNGSIIVQKSGYQYRPDAWKNPTTLTPSANRPGNVTTELVTVNSTWWGNFNYRGFNISIPGVSHMNSTQMEAATRAFAIFIPVD